MISIIFLLGSAGSIFFLDKVFLLYVHLSYNYSEIGFCCKGLLIVYGLGCCLRYVVQFY